jgi:1,4-dihydroxy-2-naphthoate octaprenyltransferase
LQILSNLANDFGDYKTGADNEERIGPQRALQSGIISISGMRNAIIFVALLTLISGSVLLYEATSRLYIFLLFFIIGLLCIAAAIKYTMGKNPYGYSGFGDIAVFIFFGIIGVGGTFYLHANYFHPDILLPACTLGFLSAGVLNVNNMRDINTDGATGKRTIVVRMGLPNAKKYHLFLIVSAFICLTYFTLFHWNSPWQWVFLITLPLFVIHLARVMKSDSEGMDRYLKQLAISTLLLVLCFGISIALNPYV